MNCPIYGLGKTDFNIEILNIIYILMWRKLFLYQEAHDPTCVIVKFQQACLLILTLGFCGFHCYPSIGTYILHLSLQKELNNLFWRKKLFCFSMFLWKAKFLVFSLKECITIISFGSCWSSYLLVFSTKNFHCLYWDFTTNIS
jgi:hypothetical protein